MTGADFVRLARRAMYVVSRARVTLVDDTGVVQKHQVDFGPQGPAGSLSIRDTTYAVYHFGFGSSPPAGADAVVLQVGGDRSMAVVIGSNHQQYRLKNLAPGETRLYDQWGQSVHLSAAGIDLTDQWGNTVQMRQGQITLQHTAKVIVEAPDVELGASGGPAVARVGDSVSGGVITSGSAKVHAA